MVQLDYLEELKAIRKCVQLPGFRVGVFTKLIHDAKCVYMDFVNEICLDEEEKDAISKVQDRYVTFKNGSSIRFLSAGDSARGHKFNFVLYDKDISSDILYSVVAHTELRYEE